MEEPSGADTEQTSDEECSFTPDLHTHACYTETATSSSRWA